MKDAHISKQNLGPRTRNCPKVLLQGICLEFKTFQPCHHFWEIFVCTNIHILVSKVRNKQQNALRIILSFISFVTFTFSLSLSLLHFHFYIFTYTKGGRNNLVAEDVSVYRMALASSSHFHLFISTLSL